MENFLDSCVVIHYSNYIGADSNKIIRKCSEFILREKGKFILCYASLEEISNFRKRRQRIHKEVIEKLKNNDYELSKNLDFRSLVTAKKLYEEFKTKNIEEILSYLKEQSENSNLKIDQFLGNILGERVIPLEQIDNELVKKIYDIIPNHADCKILASAVQLQNTREIFLFVTADGKDLDPNGYEYLQEHFEINYSKENYKFPKLLNLMFTS